MENNAEVKINGDKNIVYILQNNEIQGNGCLEHFLAILGLIFLAVFLAFFFLIVSILTSLGKSPETYKPWLKVENQIVKFHNTHNQIKEVNWCQGCKNEISLYFKDHLKNKNRNDIHKYSLCPICKFNLKLQHEEVIRLNKISHKKTNYITILFDKYPLISE
ncbi:MAG: hypothetical protein RLZZ64_1425 [Bacteroidota bacterium]|jgi:hypothetical protein